MSAQTQSLLLRKPLKQRSKSALPANIFTADDPAFQLANPSSEGITSFDVVGPKQLKSKILSRYQQKLKKCIENAQDTLNQFNSTNGFNGTTTINRNTMITKFSRNQIDEVTKQSRNLSLKKQYEDYWKSTTGAIKRLTKKNTVLMDRNVKNVYVHPNPDKLEVINDNIVPYWEMSLRNNHHILKRHIKGNKFDEVEREKLMQLRDGVKKVEESIPDLPVAKLSNYNRKEDFMLKGKNKIGENSFFNSVKTGRSSASRNGPQQVYKVSYTGELKYMSTENL